MKISKLFLSAALIFIFPLTANAATIVFDSVINGAQANGGDRTRSAAVGNAAMTFDTESMLFSWFIGWEDSNLSGPVTAIHFHGPATARENAGVVIPVFDPGNFPAIDSTLTNPEFGSAMLIDDQANDLMANLWYINIHTAENPGGEIRGQVTGGPGLSNPVVPLPGAAWLFLSGIAGLLIVKRRNIA